MAESDLKPQTETRKKLKYLEFVQAAALYVVVCFTGLYEYAKENSGPLKPGVQTVEGTVKTVVGPVYDKFHDVPFKLLKFADGKVDDVVNELDKHVPSALKRASSQAFAVAYKAPEVARAVAEEVKQAGVVDTAKSVTKTVYAKCEPAAKELYAKYEPVAEDYAVLAWRSMNRLPLFPQVAQIVVPTAGYWSEKYNRAVCYGAQRGYTVSTYLPLIPTDRIAKVFGGAENGPAVETNGKGVEVAQ